MSDTACLCLQTYVFTKSWRFKAINRRTLQDEMHDGHHMGEVALTDQAKPEHATNGLANGHTNGGFGMFFSQSSQSDEYPPQVPDQWAPALLESGSPYRAGGIFNASSAGDYECQATICL